MRFLARVTAVVVVLCGVACAQTSAPSASAPSKGAANSEAAKLLPYQDSRVPVEERITDLIGRMTLEEKLAMLGTDPTIPRLGIVGTNHVEGLHGLALGGPGGWGGRGLVTPTTQFPQSHGLGQTWDPELLRQAAAEEAYETRWAYNKFHKGGLVVRAPNADLSRDPRWGRTEESYGEDPFLVGTLATAYTEGLQGNDPKLWMTASLLKHFLANSNEDGRDGSSSNFDDRLFYEYYSVPFRMAIEDGHANAMMTSYNSWNKVPMGANPILHKVVMKDWGFDGIICTDAGALGNMVKASHTYATNAEAAAAAIHAGINQFLENATPPVRDALNQGLIKEADLDANLRGVFRVMIRLGMLEPAGSDPLAHIGWDAQAKGVDDPWWWEKNKALARKVTDESIVLLKNEGGLLPLIASAKKIAVIGPLADKVALDWYAGTPPFTVTPLAGIRARAGKTAEVTYSDGSDMAAAAELASKVDVAVVIIGNHPTCDAGWNKCPLPSDGKEAIDRKTLTLAQEDLAKAVLAANPKTVVVLQASFPFTTTWTQEHVPAVLLMTHDSEEQGDGLADVLFGDYNPAGRVSQTWVASMDQLPPMMDYDLRHGRTYMYLKDKPLYVFGYGLSYTKFAYSNLRVSTPRLAKDGSVTVSVDVKNTGKRDGDEVVELYVSHVDSKVDRPQQELKGFKRVMVKAGETRTVAIPLKASSLAYWDGSAMTVENDTAEIRVGGSSDAIALRKQIKVGE
jgi:beta-glucosidase